MYKEKFLKVLDSMGKYPSIMRTKQMIDVNSLQVTAHFTTTSLLRMMILTWILNNRYSSEWTLAAIASDCITSDIVLLKRYINNTAVLCVLHETDFEKVDYKGT